MHYTQEQIDRANAVSLEDFLRSQGEELLKSGREYRWKKHDSLTVRGNKWFRHSQSKGGFPVDFVMEFYGKSFSEAVALLLNDTGYVPDKQEPQFRLPARSNNNEAAYRYLSEKRKIAPSLLDVFFKAGDVYEDAAHGNVVFVGRDKDGIPRYAHARGLENQSRRDVSGSDKSCGFSYCGRGSQLFAFEAPIDLLSFICLYPDKWMQRSYVSLGGVSGKALDRFLSERRDIKKVFLCTDNDEAGNAAALRLAQTVADGIEVVRFTPVMKDWNEVLCHADQFPNRRYHAESSTLKEAAAENPVPMIRMSDVVSAEVEWLWKPYIPLPQMLVDCLREARASSSSEYVVANRDGDPLSYSQFKRVWQYIVTRSTKERTYVRYVNGEKIVHTVTPVLGEKAAHNGNVVYSLDFQVTPHQLRHTYITNLIYSGADPKTVQYLAGHKRSKITMDIYAKVKYNKPNQLSSVVNKAFAPKTNSISNDSEMGEQMG